VKQFQLIEIEGEAYERGRQHGARVAVALRQNAEVYLQLIEFHGGLGREVALEAASQFGPIIETHAPDLWLEMQGIAAGAGCDLVQVLLINARSELMRHMGECTALAAAPEVTLRGQTLLGQNWDWYTAFEAEPILLHIRQPGKPEILTLTEPGQVGKIGMNSAGLGVCLNFLSHADRGAGVPVHVILRQMLGSAHLGEAIREAYRVPRGGAANILLAHAEGEIIDLELTAANEDYVYGDSGWLVHANHYESPRLRGGDTGVTTSMSTQARAARARRLVSAAAVRGDVSLDTLRAIFGDHAYGAYAICRHAVADEPPLQRSATLASVMMDLGTREMHLASGQPCQHDYQVLTLPDTTS
jgi:isopenicillin-N N-acyltransferase-like protein